MNNEELAPVEGAENAAEVPVLKEVDNSDMEGLGVQVDPSESLTQEGWDKMAAEAGQTSTEEPKTEVQPAETGEYFSGSTIDSPPRGMSEEEKKKELEEEKKDEDFKKPRQSDLYRGERIFEVSLAVNIKPVSGQATKVTLMSVKEVRGTVVEDLLALSLEDARNVQIIQAILDNPKDRKRAGEADDEAEEGQQSMF